MSDLERNQIVLGDADAVLRNLPADSIDTIITSPPYFLLRDYQVEGQLGLEGHVDSWVEHLVTVTDQLARVLKPTGSLWLNLGDSYSRHDRYGAPPKSLLLGPERLLLALSARGWIVRNKIVWAKSNPMPHSVADRLTCTWEPLYLLVRSRSYFFDLDAIRQPHATSRASTPRTGRPRPSKYGAVNGRKPDWAGPLAGKNDGLDKARAEGRAGHPLGKNPGDVWTFATAGHRGAHFAVFPERLIERPLLASCPERVCVRCGAPWRRRPYRQLGAVALRGRLRPGCDCAAAHRPGLVLDPFIGSGTVAVAAERVGRDWLGIELKAEFRQLALARIARTGASTGGARDPGRSPPGPVAA